jgi:hypothetical protein
VPCGDDVGEHGRSHDVLMSMPMISEHREHEVGGDEEEGWSINHGKHDGMLGSFRPGPPPQFPMPGLDAMPTASTAYPQRMLIVNA